MRHAGKRRKTAITLQGRFQQPLSLDDLVTGQEFPRAARNLPAKWLLETVLLQAGLRDWGLGFRVQG